MEFSADTKNDQDESNKIVPEPANIQSHKTQSETKNHRLRAVVDKLMELMDSAFTKYGANTPERKHLFIMLFVTIIFSAGCHVMQILIFLLWGSLLLASINFASICIYVICITLLLKGKTSATGIVFSGEIAVVGVILTCLMGNDTFLFAYFFVLLLIQMMIPYAGWRIRIPVIMSVITLLFGSFAISVLRPPVIDITPIKIYYSVFNIMVGASSVVATVAVNNLVNRMISQLQKTKLDQYMNKAHVDELTGLYNRRYAQVVFDEICGDSEQGDRWCVAMLDIDDFKQVNDHYGHSAGDSVLQAISAAIKASLRKTDHVFRWGGEEFLILIRNASVEDSYHTLEKMRKTIQDNQIKIGAHDISLTVTIGLCEHVGQDIIQSVELSDQNLYKGKSSGKNVVVM